MAEFGKLCCGHVRFPEIATDFQGERLLDDIRQDELTLKLDKTGYNHSSHHLGPSPHIFPSIPALLFPRLPPCWLGKHPPASLT